VGDRTGLTTEVEDDFRAAGMSHLLAVSGANLAIVGGVVLGLLRALRVDPRLSVLVSAAAVVGFVVLARPSPSVLRAAVMGGPSRCQPRRSWSPRRWSPGSTAR